MLIDCHSHFDRYGAALDGAIEEVEASQILTISVSMDVASYRSALEIAKRSRFIVPAFGIHPWEAPAFAHNLGELDEYVKTSPTVGEIGLDYHFVKDASLYPAQRKVFDYLLGACADQDKVVNLHTKGAEVDILRALETLRIRRPIVHWYSGPMGLLDRFLAQGAYFTVGVEVLHSGHIQAMACALPLERLLTETDNPGGLEWLTGRIGMPSALSAVIAKTAESRGLGVEDLEQAVASNFRNLVWDVPAFAVLASAEDT